MLRANNALMTIPVSSGLIPLSARRNNGVRMTFLDYVLHFRRFKKIETLEMVIARMEESNPLDALNIHSAADHRRVELKANKIYDPGKVPSSAWKLLY